MSGSPESLAPPSPRGFAWRTGAYLLLILAAWPAYRALLAGVTGAWDHVAERPWVAEKPSFLEEGCALGIYRPEVGDDLREALRVEEAFDRRFSVASVYSAWGSGRAGDFPERWLTYLSNAGYLPMLTWEPWTTEFEEEEYGPRSSRSYRSMRDVAEGRYDAYVRAWARECMAWGRPLLLRFGHEMNNPRYPWSFASGNSAEDFKAAWIRVREIFAEAGCRNVSWGWTPLAGAEFEAYWPGEEHVDWVGVAVLNYGEMWPPYEWWSFERLLAASYERLAAFGKPVVVAEMASVGESVRKGDWNVDALHSLATTFPLVRLVVLFDAPLDRSHFEEGVPWEIAPHPAVLKRMAEELRAEWFRAMTSARSR